MHESKKQQPMQVCVRYHTASATSKCPLLIWVVALVVWTSLGVSSAPKVCKRKVLSFNTWRAFSTLSQGTYAKQREETRENVKG